MRIITVGRNAQYETKVSDEDFDYLSGFLWTFAVSHKNGGLVYARRSIREGTYNRTIFLHHMVLERRGLIRPSLKHTCDHRNGDSLDNQRRNLRWATAVQQMANRHGIRAVPIARIEDEIPF